MPLPAGSAGRLLVTGAAGFVGKHLLGALRSEFPDATLIAAARAQSRTAMPAEVDEFVAFDLLQPEGMADAVAAARPDGVVHLAAQASVLESFVDPLANWRVNLIGTLALAEAVLAQAPGCRFVQASSAEIYGLSFRAATPLDETAALQPANPYAASKAACDLAIGELALRGLDAVRLRAFNHTGSGQSENFVVPAFARQISAIEAGRVEPVLRVGALDRWRDFLDVRDVCRAYAAALRMPANPGIAINIASGVPRRVGDILDALLARSTVSPRVEAEPTRLRSGDITHVVGNPGRARDLLGWRPEVPWDDTLDAVLGHWRQRQQQQQPAALA